MEDSRLIKMIRALIVIAAFVAALIICMRILVLKSEDGIKQMESFYLQEEDTVDVLLMGSSHIYCDVNTGILWDEYGISAYDLGGAEQPYWNTYYFLKEALKTQTPKVIVLDITIPGIRSVEHQPEVWSVTNLYGLNWNKNRYDATKISVPGGLFGRVFNPFNTMHTRYDELSKDDFVDANRSINYKGFDLREAISPYEMRDMSDVTEKLPMTEKEETYFRKIIEYTKEKNIPLLLVSVPFPVQRYENAQKIYNYEFAIAEEEGIPYIDYNKGYYDKIGLDFSVDMADEFHLNTSGNEKFTKYLGQQLKESYGLTDHKGDKKYGSWEVDALNQRQENSRVALALSDSPGEYFLNLLNDQYITYVSLGYGAEISSFIYDNRTILNRLGLTQDYYITDEMIILTSGKIIYASSDEEQEGFIDLDDMKLMLSRDKDKDGNMISTLRINESKYSLNTAGIKFIVYDKVLKKVVSEMEYEL